MNNNIETLRKFVRNEMHGGLGRDAVLALMTLVGEGSTVNVIAGVDQVIARMQQFRIEAVKLLPPANGGLDGLSLEEWKTRLAAKDVEIYPCPNHRISRFGYTDCDAADYTSEDEAVKAAVAQYFG